MEMAPAVDHTAKTQFNGSKALAEQIATIYSESPLANRDGKRMDVEDYARKSDFQNMDHAADGKLKHKLFGSWKKNILYEDMGASIAENMDTEELLSALVSITDEEIKQAYSTDNST
jgi:hypothetical protein